MLIERALGFPPRGEPGLCWLGQAGFWYETGAHRILIDPYLSDSLGKKYACAKNPHIRMMPAPFAPGELPRPDLVLITHAHTDHMDPETLGKLHARFPGLRFVVPAAKEEMARQRIGHDANLLLVDAGQIHAPLPGVELTVFPAAHEGFDLDEQGRHSYLGYGVTTARSRIYHSGDSIPFDDLDALIAAFQPDVLLLPVNGRDAERLADGVPGNFTLQEARALAAAYPYLVPHHFGMFDFNTLDPRVIDAAADDGGAGAIIVRPKVGEFLRLLAHEALIPV